MCREGARIDRIDGEIGVNGIDGKIALTRKLKGTPEQGWLLQLFSSFG